MGYNFAIMLKRFGFWERLFLGAVLIAGAIVAVTYKDQQARVKYQSECQERMAKIAGAPEPNPASADQCRDPQKYMPWWDILVAWPEGIGAWVVIGTGFVIAWQSYETRRAAEATKLSVAASDKAYTLAEKTAKRQLRPYLVMRDCHLVIDEDGFVEPKIELVNCGQTPAYDLRGGTICRFTSYPVPAPKPMPSDLRKSQTTLGAGHGYWILPAGTRHDGSDGERLIARLSEGGTAVVYSAVGYYTYRDIFQDFHWIKFQLVIGGPSGFRQSVKDGRLRASFSPDSEGNEEDWQQKGENPN